MMTKVSEVAENVVAIVTDGLLNSHKVPEDQCQDYLSKTKNRIEQVPSLDCGGFLGAVVKQVKVRLEDDVFYQF